MVRRKILGNFLALTWTQVAGRLIRFAYLVAIARFLSKADVGVYSYGMAAYITATAIGLFGQDLLLSTRIGRKRAMFGAVAGHSLVVVLAALLLATVAGLAGLWLTEPDGQHLVELSVLMLSTFARGLVGWVRNCFVALEKATWIPGYELRFRGAEALAGIAALASGGGLLAICGLHLMFWVLELAMSWGLLQRTTEFGVGFKFSARLLRRYASASVAMMFSPWLLFMFPQFAVIGLRQIQPSLAVVAYLGVAMQILTTFFVVPVALAQAITPGLARAIRSPDQSDLLVVLTALKACLVMGALIAAISVPIAPVVVDLAFGERYSTAGHVLTGLMWALGPYSAVFVAVAALNGIGERGRATVAALVMVASMLAALAWLYVHSSSDAAGDIVVAFVASSFVGMAWSFVSLTRTIRSARRGWWVKATLLCLAAVAIGSSGNFSALTAAAASCLLVILGTAGLSILTRDELRQMVARRAISGINRSPAS